MPTATRIALVTGGSRGLGKNMAQRLARQGNDVIMTDFNHARVRDNPDMNAFIASQTALERAGQSDDIGGVVAFLASEEARWITGQRIEVSGGMFL
jgi:NAD(P)-dependent dehydrogenase (short-subunit alcohol dehydrogenase family)